MESAKATQPDRKSGGTAVREQLVQQETEGLRQLNLGREQVLARLWEIANLAPEMTRSSITGQVKALAMIVAMQGLNSTSSTPRKPHSVLLQTPEPLLDKKEPLCLEAVKNCRRHQVINFCCLCCAVRLQV
jgi:hypothetical protein